MFESRAGILLGRFSDYHDAPKRAAINLSGSARESHITERQHDTPSARPPANARLSRLFKGGDGGQIDPMTVEIQSEIQGPASFCKCRSNRNMKAASAAPMIGKAKNHSINPQFRKRTKPPGGVCSPDGFAGVGPDTGKLSGGRLISQ
jgi:hypothetical protein